MRLLIFLGLIVCLTGCNIEKRHENTWIEYNEIFKTVFKAGYYTHKNTSRDFEEGWEFFDSRMRDKNYGK